MPLADERGSSVAEFTMVIGLITVLMLGVVQLALALLVRNTVLDAASEGARHAALADRTLDDGIERTHDLISTAIGATYADDVSAWFETNGANRVAVVQVRAPLPIIGLIGVSDGVEVRGHAVREPLG